MCGDGWLEAVDRFFEYRSMVGTHEPADSLSFLPARWENGDCEAGRRCNQAKRHLKAPKCGSDAKFFWSSGPI